MKQYLDLLRDVRENGEFKEDRTGTGTLSVFGRQMRFDLSTGHFPLVTTKKCHLKSIIHELLWFLKGETNIRYLKENGVSIWDEWADESGDLGPVYGYQWRSWPAPNGESIDQIAKLIHVLKTNPDSRRMIVSAWNPALVDEMALPPCHALFQFYSKHRPWSDVMGDLIDADLADEFDELTRHMRSNFEEGLGWTEARDNASGYRHPDYYKAAYEFAEKKGVPTRLLSCQLYQRSCDTLIGLPFNIASYALLTMMVAQCTNHLPGEFVWTGGDVHLYSNHIEQADLQLTREPKRLPVMVINQDVKDIFSFCYEDFELRGYEFHPHIAAPVAV